MLHCMALMSEAVKIVCFFSFDDNVVSLIGFPEEVANVMVRGDEGSATSAAAVDSQVPTSRRSDEVNFSLAHGLPVAAIASRLLSRVLLLHSWGFPRPIFEKQVEHVLIAIVRISGTAVVHQLSSFGEWPLLLLQHSVLMALLWQLRRPSSSSSYFW